MLRGNSSLFGGSSGFNLQGAPAKYYAFSLGQEGGGDPFATSANLIEKAGQAATSSGPVTQNLSQPYYPQSLRYKEAMRSNAPRASTPAIADDLMQMLRQMPAKPSISTQGQTLGQSSQLQGQSSLSPSSQGGALEQKEAYTSYYETYATPSDFLFRDKNRTPEERKQVQRIRQPLSPMIHSMLRSKESKEAREESKAVPIMTQSNTPQRAAIQEIMQALETPAPSIEPPVVDHASTAAPVSSTSNSAPVSSTSNLAPVSYVSNTSVAGAVDSIMLIKEREIAARERALEARETVISLQYQQEMTQRPSVQEIAQRPSVQELAQRPSVQEIAQRPPLYVPSKFDPTDLVEYIAVAETVENRLWNNRLYLFDFDHPNNLPRDFSFSREYCENNSVDYIEANSIVEIQLPPVFAKDATQTMKNVPWVRLMMVSLDEGTVSKLWCPIHDGRGNRFIGNIYRMTDYISAIVEFTRQELEPLLDKVDAIHAMMETMGLTEK